MPSQAAPEQLRERLVSLGCWIRDTILANRRGRSAVELSGVLGDRGGDTIYAIDRFGENAIIEWFTRNWPEEWPVQVVMEGLEDETLCFPRGIGVEETKWKCILDPIDGTRGLMYDKRSAWTLGGIAPQEGCATMLSDIVAASMVEIPASKQWRSDVLSTTLSGPVVAWSDDVRGGGREELRPTPSGAVDFAHGFSSFSKFFPEGRTLTAQIEERLWDELVGLNVSASPTVFDDQYISTGGQFYEIITGHDRMVADIRPLVLRCLDMESSLVCHPYDACAALILQRCGGIYEHPLGGFPDAPLDTSSEVAWVAYANETLAAQASPILRRILGEFIP